MRLLALDTATSAITVAAHDGTTVLAARSVEDARHHTEHLAPTIEAVLGDAGWSPRALSDIVVGTGPGPFTGLRVGIVTALTLGHATGARVHGVCSLDALARAAREAHPQETEVLVATDARRREVYWARYRDGARVEGPDVCRAAELPDALRALPTVGRGPLLYPDALADPLTAPGRPLLDVDAAALARVAVDGIRAGSPMPTTPLYLRRPDAQEPGAPKSATSPTPVRRSDVLEPSKGTP